MVQKNMDDQVSQIGLERFKADKRQIGGLLLLTAIVATVQPLASIASLIGPDGTTASEGIPASSLAAGIFQVFMGTVGVFVGYMSLVHDQGNKYLTGFLILITQLAFVPFLTDLTAVGRGARSDPLDNGFIPLEYNPTKTDVRFVGAMGMLGILTYGTSFLGSLGFMEFALYSFQAGKPGARSASYYGGRFVFYTSLLALAGLSQLMLGIYILSNIGSGPLPEGPVSVAMYFVNFPELSVFVGLYQLLTGLYGIFRSISIGSKTDHTFQVAIAVQWLLMLSIQIMTQISYAPGDTAAASASAIACLSLGLNLLPAFLEFKMRTIPEELATDAVTYYGMLEETVKDKPDDEVSADDMADNV